MSDTPVFDNVNEPTPIADKVAQDQQTAKTIAAANISVVKSTNASISVITPFWAPYAKAVVAAILAFLVAFLSALLPFMENGHVVSLVGWVTAAIAGLVAMGASAGVVYMTPNVSKE